MDVHKLSTTQIILVKFDEIPLNKLITRPYLRRFSKFFEFSQNEVLHQLQGEDMFAIMFRHGLFKGTSGKKIIDHILVEDRKFLIKIDGCSEDADEVFKSLTAFLAELAEIDKPDYLEPILIAEESEIIAHLDFAASLLVSPSYLAFVNSAVNNEANSETAEADIKLSSFVFRLEYTPRDKSLREQRITLSPKEFVVQPRIGTLLTDQIYYSKAPFRTNTHIALLEELEKTLSGN